MGGARDVPGAAPTEQWALAFDDEVLRDGPGVAVKLHEQFPELERDFCAWIRSAEPAATGTHPRRTRRRTRAIPSSRLLKNPIHSGRGL